MRVILLVIISVMAGTLSLSSVFADDILQTPMDPKALNITANGWLFERWVFEGTSYNFTLSLKNNGSLTPKVAVEEGPFEEDYIIPTSEGLISFSPEDIISAEENGNLAIIASFHIDGDVSGVTRVLFSDRGILYTPFIPEDGKFHNAAWLGYSVEKYSDFELSEGEKLYLGIAFNVYRSSTVWAKTIGPGGNETIINAVGGFFMSDLALRQTQFFNIVKPEDFKHIIEDSVTLPITKTITSTVVTTVSSASPTTTTETTILTTTIRRDFTQTQISTVTQEIMADNSTGYIIGIGIVIAGIAVAVGLRRR